MPANVDNTENTNNRTLIDIVSKLSATVQLLQKNVTTLTGQVSFLLQNRWGNRVHHCQEEIEITLNETATSDWANFSLDTAYNQLNNSTSSAAEEARYS